MKYHLLVSIAIPNIILLARVAYAYHLVRQEDKLR